MGHMDLLTRRQILNLVALSLRVRRISCGNIASKGLRCLFSLQSSRKRLLTPTRGNEWNKDLKCLLGQVGKSRSATTPKLASWNVHEQSFLAGRVLKINQLVCDKRFVVTNGADVNSERVQQFQLFHITKIVLDRFTEAIEVLDDLITELLWQSRFSYRPLDSQRVAV